MNLGEYSIHLVDWNKVDVLRGTGQGLALAMEKLLLSSTSDEMEECWRDIEGVAFAQDTVYGAAEDIIDIVLAALADDRPPLVREWLLELLYFLLKGGSLDDLGLPGRCRDRGRRGAWLLARLAGITQGRERALLLATIELVDPRVAEVVRGGIVDGNAG